MLFRSFFLNPSEMLTAIETPRGRYIYTSEGDTCAFVDYLSQKCVIPNKSARKRLKEFVQQSNKGLMLVSTRINLLLVDTSAFTIKDSLLWSELSDHPEFVVPMLEQQQPVLWNGRYLFFIVAGLGLIGGGWFVYKRRTKSTNGSATGVPVEKTPVLFDGFVLGEKDGVLQFNGHLLENLMDEQEVNLLRILMVKKKAGETLNTLQFNEIGRAHV